VCRDFRDARDGTIYNAVDCFQLARQGGGFVTSGRKFFLRVIAGAALLVAGARAAEPLNPPAPLVPAPVAMSPGEFLERRTAAERALQLGFSSIAADLYRQLLAAPGADRAALTLDLATALLEAGRTDEAESVLRQVSANARGSRWHLRAGLAAVQAKNFEAAGAELAAIKEQELPPGDFPWRWFLEGAVADMTGPSEAKRAQDFFSRAEAAAPNDIVKARFQLAREEVALRRGLVLGNDELRVALQNYEAHQGRPAGYDSAITYAVMADALGRHTEAMAFLQTVWITVPKQERTAWDRVRLVLGLIGERGRSFAGRKALTELLESGSDPERQRQALQLLWEAARTSEPARAQLRTDLDRMIAAPAKHPILESLLLYRAQLALAEKKDDEAAASAGRLIEQFPGSPLRAQAFGLLTQLAWEQRRYRLAAFNARKARDELAQVKAPATPGKVQPREAEMQMIAAQLGVVEAEAWFRAGDYRNAADAYVGALRNPPENVPAGDLLFQRVVAEIRSGSADAAKVLDDVERDPAFDLQNRWQAEWILARTLQTQGDAGIKAAYARVQKLLSARTGDGASAVAAIKPELRARMEWLQARLSLDADSPEQTMTLVDTLLKSLADVDAALRTEIASTALLRKAEAQFQLARAKKLPESAGLETLQKIRADYPKSEAAIQSFLSEADYYASKDQIVEAQKRLKALTDNPDYKGSAFVPYAFYQLALYSEQLGQNKDLEDANRYIEALVNTPGAASQTDLFFRARMKQGEILRRLNYFPQAQQVYQDLIDNGPPTSTENKILAKLELARCHNAQKASDSSHAEQAQLLFVELRERVDAPLDVRVEAGYNLGELLVASGRVDEAAKVWWADVVTPFLLEQKTPFEPAAKRPYWLARTLLRLGEVLEKQGRLEDAKNAYTLVVQKKLAGAENLAAKELARLAGSPSKG
jgi:TolA-binding protein